MASRGSSKSTFPPSQAKATDCAARRGHTRQEFRCFSVRRRAAPGARHLRACSKLLILSPICVTYPRHAGDTTSIYGAEALIIESEGSIRTKATWPGKAHLVH